MCWALRAPNSWVLGQINNTTQVYPPLKMAWCAGCPLIFMSPRHSWEYPSPLMTVVCSIHTWIRHFPTVACIAPLDTTKAGQQEESFLVTLALPKVWGVFSNRVLLSSIDRAMARIWIVRGVFRTPLTSNLTDRLDMYWPLTSQGFDNSFLYFRLLF